MSRLVQTLLASVPLLLTPVLVYSLAGGILNFGGGEKDILLALPWLIWALIFALCSYVLIFRRWPMRAWLFRSALAATAVLIGLALIIYGISYLGSA